jgi:hypothetical protein
MSWWRLHTVPAAEPAHRSSVAQDAELDERTGATRIAIVLPSPAAEKHG